jgi:hypothetical protein
MGIFSISWDLFFIKIDEFKLKKKLIFFFNSKFIKHKDSNKYLEKGKRIK